MQYHCCSIMETQRRFKVLTIMLCRSLIVANEDGDYY